MGSVCVLYEARNPSATSTPCMWVVYSRCMGDVIMSSCTAPFLLGTVGTGMQGNPIGSAYVEKNKIGFLSFYRIHAIFRVSCILQSKVSYGAFLKVPLFLKTSSNLIQFDLTIPMALICMEANSSKNLTDVKKLSILITCYFLCTFATKSKTTLWANLTSSQATRTTSSLSSLFYTIHCKISYKFCYWTCHISYLDAPLLRLLRHVLAQRTISPFTTNHHFINCAHLF